GSSGGIIKDFPQENLEKTLKIGDVCVADGGVQFYERECEKNSRFFEYSLGNYEVFQLPREFLDKISVKSVKFGSSGSFSEEQARVAEKKGLEVIDNEAASIAQVCFLLGKTRFLPIKVVSDVNSGDKHEQMQMFEDNLKEVSLKLAGKVKEIVEFLSEERVY
ncbi:MAG: hypothetical protein KDK45_20170, partial [Leptospiraceae bacterium]|nr:hypothetical protein [Leptospiraceae bacterium]